MMGEKRGEELVTDWINEQITKGKKPKELVGTKLIHGNVLYELGRYTKQGYALKMHYGIIGV